MTDEYHRQPSFSHVAAGAARMDEAVRSQASVMPRDARWIKDEIVDVLPREETVTLADGRRIGSDHLVVAPGVHLDLQAVPGLADAMDGIHGASDYDPALVSRTWELIQNLRSGTAVFTQPRSPSHRDRPSAPELRKRLRARPVATGENKESSRTSTCTSWSPPPTVFGMPVVDAELNRTIAEYGITLHTASSVRSVDATTRTLELTQPTRDILLTYDLLHAVPPQSAPAWLKSTTLPAADDPGGYSECPFTLSRGTAFFPEFDEKYQPMKSFPLLKMATERRWQWVVDRWIFPQVYWHLILRGRA